MSRTLKDDPQWVAQSRLTVIGEDHMCGVRRECDIDVPLSATNPSNWCERVNPASDADAHLCRPKDTRDLHDGYYAPERVAVRESLTEITKLHRGGGDLEEVLVPLDQHHHMPLHRGYWD